MAQIHELESKSRFGTRYIVGIILAISTLLVAGWIGFFVFLPIKSGMSTVYELEERLADYVGLKYCISCSSGTDALLIPLMAMGIGPGDAIITTPFTYIATVEVISLLGATPVFCDIDSENWCINPKSLEKLITPKTKAVIAVDLFGNMPDYDSLKKICFLLKINIKTLRLRTLNITTQGLYKSRYLRRC